MLTFNGLLAAISTLLVVYIVRELVTPFGKPPPVQPAAVAAMVPDSPSRPTAVVSQARNTLIVARNLFSPDRSDSPGGGAATAGAPATARVKPQLFGVVLGQIATAYLEDPITKHVGGYRVGEVVAGASIRAIEATGWWISRMPSRTARVVSNEISQAMSPGEPCFNSSMRRRTPAPRNALSSFIHFRALPAAFFVINVGTGCSQEPGRWKRLSRVI